MEGGDQPCLVKIAQGVRSLAVAGANDYDAGMAAGGARAERRRRIGLALGAGGARGFAHIGVLRGLAEAQIPVDAIAGTSIGALIGAVYAAGQLEKFEREVLNLQWPDIMRMFDPVWPRSGLISGERAIEWLTGLIGDWRIEDLAIPFVAVSVDLITGEEVLIREGRVTDAIRASISIPGIFVPPRAGKRLFVDGALRNPVPVSALQDLGVDTCIAVNLHGQPVRELSQPSARSSWTARTSVGQRAGEMIERSLARFRRRGRGSHEEEEIGPNLFEILTASMTVVEHELARHRLAREPVDILIEPDVHTIRSLEFQKARKAIHAGLRQTREQADEIRAAFKKRRYWRRPNGAR